LCGFPTPECAPARPEQPHPPAGPALSTPPSPCQRLGRPPPPSAPPAPAARPRVGKFQLTKRVVTQSTHTVQQYAGTHRRRTCVTVLPAGPCGIRCVFPAKLVHGCHSSAGGFTCKTTWRPSLPDAPNTSTAFRRGARASMAGASPAIAARLGAPFWVCCHTSSASPAATAAAARGFKLCVTYAHKLDLLPGNSCATPALLACQSTAVYCVSLQ